MKEASMADKDVLLKDENNEGLHKKRRGGTLPFFLIVIAVVASMAFVVIFSYISFYNRAKNDARELGNAVLSEKAERFTGYIEKAKAAIEVAAVAVEDEMRKSIDYDGIHSVFVTETNMIKNNIDPDFSGVYGVVNGEYHDGADWIPGDDFVATERPWYKAALTGNGEIVMIPPYIDIETGEVCITFSKLLYDKKSVVSFDVFLNMLQSLVSEIKISGNGYAFVTTNDGTVIAHTDKSEVGKDYSKEERYTSVLQRANLKNNDFVTKIDGEESTVFTQEAGEGCYVFLIVKNRELYSNVKGIFYRDLIVFFLISALVVLLGSIAVRHSMKQLEDEEELVRKVEIANRSNQLKSVFLSSMRHEIRTPINSVLGMNEMIERESSEDNIISYSKNIESAGYMLLTIVNNILDFSKLESGEVELSIRPYQTASLLNDFSAFLRERVKEKGLKAIVDISENIPSYLSGDQTRIRQIILNLITNAMKFTERGSVTFRAFGRELSENEYLLSIVVDDTGVGIKKEELDKLFSSFEKGERSTKKHVQGIGLGLSIIKGLVDAMGGTIRVESELGKGSTFTVELPQQIVDRQPAGPVAKEEIRTKEENEEAKKHPLFEAPEASVLAVDDNAINLSVLSALLKRTKMKIDTANGGAQAIEMSKEKKYDLIFMDHMMPSPDGIETLHIIKGDPDNPNAKTPEIVLTANAVAGAEKMYLDEGFDAYLTKPVNPKRIEKLIKKMLPEEKISVSYGL